MLAKILRFIDMVSEWTGKLGSYLIMALTMAIGYDVVMRYFFIKPTFWVFDMTYMLFGAISMLGMAYCHVSKGHVRMDLIYSRLSARRQALVNVVCYLVLFFPLFICLIWKIGEDTMFSIASGERSAGSVWRPVLGPFKLTVFFGFFLFFLQGLADFIRELIHAVKGTPYDS